MKKICLRSLAFIALLSSCLMKSASYMSSRAPFEMNVLSAGNQGFERWGYFPSTKNANSCLALNSSNLAILNKHLINGKNLLIQVTIVPASKRSGKYLAAITAYDASGDDPETSNIIIHQRFDVVYNYAGLSHHNSFASATGTNGAALTGALTGGSSVIYKRRAGLNGFPSADARYQESVINSAGGITWILVKGISPAATIPVAFSYTAPIAELNCNIDFNDINNIGMSTVLPVSSANLALINNAFAAGHTVEATVSITPNSSNLLNGSISYSSSDSSLNFTADTFTNLNNYYGGKGLPLSSAVVISNVDWTYTVTGSSVNQIGLLTSGAPVVIEADTALAFTLQTTVPPMPASASPDQIVENQIASDNIFEYFMFNPVVSATSYSRFFLTDDQIHQINQTLSSGDDVIVGFLSYVISGNFSCACTGYNQSTGDILFSVPAVALPNYYNIDNSSSAVVSFAKNDISSTSPITTPFPGASSSSALISSSGGSFSTTSSNIAYNFTNSSAVNGEITITAGIPNVNGTSYIKFLAAVTPPSVTTPGANSDAEMILELISAAKEA